MNALVFLGIAAGLSMAGCGILWLRSRQPGSMEAHIRDFARELDALAPDNIAAKGRRAPPRRRGGLDRLPDSGAGPQPSVPPVRPEHPERPEPGARPRSG